MRLTPVRIVIAYAGLSAAWIALSDPVLEWLVPADLRTAVSIAKGWTFVAVTAALLAALIGRYARGLEEHRRRAVELAERSAAMEARYRLLFDANPQPMWVYDDATLRFLAVNDAALSGYGWSREEFLAQTIRAIRPPEEVAELDRYLEENRGSPNRSTPARHRRRDGSCFDVEISSQEVEWDGRPARLVLAQDVTDLHRWQAAVAESEGRFRKVLEASPNPILSFDRAGRISYANPNAGATFGWTPQELVGQQIEVLLPDSIGLANVMSDGASPAGRQGRPAGPQVRRPHGTARLRNGEAIPVDVSLGPIDTPDGPQVVATITDLSERETLERQLRQAQKMEVMGQFANILAHDFRNYLTSIGGFAELLAGDLPPDDPGRADAAEIRKAVDQASELVRNVLAFARPDRDERAATDVAVLLGDIGGFLRKLVEPTVSLEAVIPPGLSPVRIAAGSLTQVLVNLATNARDAMAAGGRLTIEATTLDVSTVEPAAAGGSSLEASEGFEALAELPPGRYVRLLVSDTGTGIDEAALRHLFEPFFSTKEAGVGAGKGSGLGLSSVYLIVTRAAGRIGVRSSPGAGTTFAIDLPVAAA